MRILLIVLLQFTLCALANAQELHIIMSKKAFLYDKRIKKGDVLRYSDKVLIKRHGFLTVSGASSKPMKLDEGMYEIGVEYQKHLERYQEHDGILNQLKSLGLEDCQFPYEIVPVSHNAHKLSGKIEIEKDSTVSETYNNTFSVVNTNERKSVQVNWTNPDENYEEKYYILIEDLFGDFYELIETDEDNFHFDLSNYISESIPILFFTIIAEDCRESYPTAVRLRME